MNNVIVRGQKQYVDLNRKLNLHNGSVVLLKNKGNGDSIDAIYYVVSFRDNKNKYSGSTTGYCTLLNLDSGQFAFEERCSRNTTVHRVLRHLLRVGYTMPYNPDATDDDFQLRNYDVEVHDCGNYKMELVLSI